jgi:hypothetical protein
LVLERFVECFGWLLMANPELPKYGFFARTDKDVSNFSLMSLSWTNLHHYARDPSIVLWLESVWYWNAFVECFGWFLMAI